MAEPKRGPSKRVMIMSGAVTVAVLAAIIMLIMAFGSPSKQAPADSATDAGNYVRRAEDALAAGETTLAVALSSKAVRLDPNSAEAAQVASQARAAQSAKSQSASNSSSGTGTSGSKKPTTSKPAAPPSNEKYEKKVKDKGALLPTEFTGYSLGDVAVTEAEAQRSGTADAAKASARQIIWTVHEMNGTRAAKDFLNNTSKSVYPQNAKNVNVDGLSVYVGTDGTRYATAAYVRGIYVFEVLVSSDVDPAQQLDLAVEAAKAFND